MSIFRIGVISESHGSTQMLMKAANALKDCDCIYHLGDHAADTEQIASSITARLVCVRGNCDFLSSQPWRDLSEVCGIRILAVHGHRENVKNGMYLLSLYAEECGAGLVLYGHTHIPNVENSGECIYVNPGALKYGNYCVIEIENGAIRPFLKRL